MRILITGATGMVGSRLLETLFTQGFSDINILTRDKEAAQKNSQFPVKAFNWDYQKNFIESGALDGVETVIHLAGEGVADGRWSSERKKRILESRSLGTKVLMDEINKNHSSVKKIISASAIGIYGDRADEQLNEQSSHDDGFLADVCEKWEAAISDNNHHNIQAHHIRVGIVLSGKGGALSKMLPPFKLGGGGILGDGKQFMSWIHVDDLVGQFIYLMKNSGKHKVYNGVAPESLTNHAFTKTLGKVLKRPTIFPVPAFMLKLIFGEMSEILLGSQNVNCAHFKDEGYEYQFPKLELALENILFHQKKNENVLVQYQWVDKDLETVFSFFSDEKNLEKITPEYLNFKVEGKNTESLEAGTVINYKLSLRGIPMRWKSKIILFEKNNRFVDEQLTGPYKKWYHTHQFYGFSHGTLMKDHVIYKLPLGALGQLVAGWYVKKDVQSIFEHRKKVLHTLF